MTERERLLKKLECVKALAERGVAGEKAAAEALLASLMSKYGITEAEIEDAEIRTYWIRYKTEYERKLIFQLAYMHLGSGHSFGCVGKYSGRSRKEVGVECTPAQYIEIEADFQFYREALAEEMGVFYSAFIQKNELFPPPELAGHVESDDPDVVDYDKIAKMKAMMNGIDQRTRHKALGDGGGDEK